MIKRRHKGKKGRGKVTKRKQKNDKKEAGRGQKGDRKVRKRNQKSDNKETEK